MANTVPWRVLSAVGRISGSLGDVFSPTKVMAVSLFINGVGLGGLLIADTRLVAYICVVFLGVGYGAAYIKTDFGIRLPRRALAANEMTSIY